MVALYGIPNCDTMKKVRAWLDAHGVDYRFHDYKREGVDETRLRAWVDELGWETLVNRRGTTWRKLPEDVREGMDAEAAVRVMLETPSIIRRPVLDTGKVRHAGFSETDYERLLG
ncbi:ArsC family reductase [Thiocapsa roseopersicina]|uniref:Transcriptional regulator, Spx/MgsR family n=1 Tax=Thiocapsa roseopersicina TaxID=1058 RepID=A0A1H2TN67_THIRO|nr:ArsC family reductase [Thiocapsa roseopersicina]SDW45228.1 transcriptional regulator, Spx/MgsR family [Thiocapsa roseopersicina]